MLLHTAEENGDVAFIVGPSNTRIRAHSIIVQSASPVKLFHENMEEGKTKAKKVSGVRDFLSVFFLFAVVVGLPLLKNTTTKT